MEPEEVQMLQAAINEFHEVLKFYADCANYACSTRVRSVRSEQGIGQERAVINLSVLVNQGVMSDQGERARAVLDKWVEKDLPPEVSQKESGEDDGKRSQV